MQGGPSPLEFAASLACGPPAYGKPKSLEVHIDDFFEGPKFALRRFSMALNGPLGEIEQLSVNR